MAIKKSYKELQSELDDVLNQLQTDDIDIDKALDLYKKGEKLIAELEKYLTSAKNEFIEISK